MNIRHLDWFYSENIEKGAIKLSSDEARHLKVRRHYENEQIAIFDGKGKVGIGRIIDKDQVEVSEIHEFSDDSFLTIAAAVPKGDRFDFMLQKLTELNVKIIIPMRTKHSVVVPRNIERYKRILLESCKQSKRVFIPEIKDVTDFNKITKRGFDNKIILDENGEKLKKLSAGTALVLVGPEGGFTDEELAEAEKSGFVKASIGKLTLRIETAAIAAAAKLL